MGSFERSLSLEEKILGLSFFKNTCLEYKITPKPGVLKKVKHWRWRREHEAIS